MPPSKQKGEGLHERKLIISEHWHSTPLSHDDYTQRAGYRLAQATLGIYHFLCNNNAVIAIWLHVTHEASELMYERCTHT